VVIWTTHDLKTKMAEGCDLASVGVRAVVSQELNRGMSRGDRTLCRDPQKIDGLWLQQRFSKGGEGAVCTGCEIRKWLERVLHDGKRPEQVREGRC